MVTLIGVERKMRGKKKEGNEKEGMGRIYEVRKKD